MNRIDRIFSDLRGGSAPTPGKALMPFITAGDPDVATTAAMLPALEEAGARIVEVGVPFSDPIADGPVIQASMSYALDRGVRVGQVFEAVASVRAKVGLGLVAMVSYSIVHRLDPRSFVRQARQAGFDGFIFPDLPLEESAAVREAVASEGMILSMLIAPATSPERAEAIARASTGFVYIVSRSGITGERSELPPELPERLRRLRGVTDLPMAVGFGVSTAEQVRQVVNVADAAIVGSALMRRVAEYRQQGGAAVVREAAAMTRELTTGLRPSPVTA
jgi:tryptophan synthase alpha chain